MQASTKVLTKGQTIYFTGICGTGMASVAGLCQQLGLKVCGSDTGVYPPMSVMLEELKIPIFSPYSANNLDAAKPDLVVIANALSRGNPEIEHVLAQNIPFTSFPALMGNQFLDQRSSIVVAGTHGKTTTCSLMAHVLTFLGEKPGYLIGGIPRNFPRSFDLGLGKTFVVEGDEYDTAFFDKGPKFLHYRPKFAIINNIEFDHADIFANVEAIEAEFEKLMNLVQNKENIIANWDDERVKHLVKKMGIEKHVTRVASLGKAMDGSVRTLSLKPGVASNGSPWWTAQYEVGGWGTVKLETSLSGDHNFANIAQVLGCLCALEKAGELSHKITPEKISEAFRSFLGVKRRLDHLGTANNVEVFEDFAHHPTAVKLVIEGFRKVYPKRRLWVAFEPRNATSRRNIFQNDYIASLGTADQVLLGQCHVDKRIPDEQRMNTTAIVNAIGTKAKAFDDNEALLNFLATGVAPGDAVIFMSSGSFSGIQHRLVGRIQASVKT